MAGIMVQREDTEMVHQHRASSTVEIVSDDDRSVAADSWSIKSEYGSTVGDEQRHLDASDPFSASYFRAASDYSSDKDEPETEMITSDLGFQTHWDATYANELENFHEHGHTGENWFGAEVMNAVSSWTKCLCVELSLRRIQNRNDYKLEYVEECADDLSAWNVLDIGTGNGLLLHEFAKKGFSDLIGIDYCENAVELAQNIAKRDGFTGIKFMVDDILQTKLGKQFMVVVDKGTLDAIGMHPDGHIRRFMYWESVAKLVAPGGLLVVTSCNSTKDELVEELSRYNQRKMDGCDPNKTGGGDFTTRRPLEYLDHVLGAKAVRCVEISTGPCRPIAWHDKGKACMSLLSWAVGCGLCWARRIVSAQGRPDGPVCGPVVGWLVLPYYI